MIQGKSVLAIIPARGGSKGVPQKNIRYLSGKPLIAWTIQEAKKSNYIDRIVVSTDDERIAEVANSWGAEVPFMRPPELAQDNTPGMAPILHAMKMIPGYDYIVELQPTSPLRTVEDIDSCLEQCIEQNVDSCVSVTLTDKSPYWMYSLSECKELIPVITKNNTITRRQDSPDVFVLNGAVFVAKSAWLEHTGNFLHEETIGFVMPKERSIDLDTTLDFALAEAIIKEEKRSEWQ
ncbi:cytidylyltransferase domain-containing protein [Brevibacillus invocatus]|uniref:acylneuraminate cytidylyltransferase family protein n=1 Tax=Brevibacillus invocatus TaxID=173959 RepID=UPI00203AD466|nr:acylneuraminate cytidylyltransferase family protein [Brevibacillus invocatus]MCM3079671.1 acylneuraminate cytidylyltransferase family protein [Brevibacillus invocatus]MCM3431119.1 acylneuraminate cytidylyltransferase family protein [Brevibacillus invocatus]